MQKTPMKVLLVEDNPGDARLLCEMFNDQVSHSVKLTHVESLSAAETHVASHAVDIIVLDLGLPDAHGMGALRRAHAAGPHIPLVVLTGLDDQALAVHALQEGAQDYLVKGQIDAHTLMRSLRYAVEHKLMELSISNDVLRLTRAEAELRQSELMLRLALDVSDQGAWRWEVGQGTDRLEWDARSRSLFGLASDTSVNYALWVNAIPAEDRAAAEAGVTRALDPADTLDEYACEYRAVHPNGSVVWVASRGRAMFEPDPTKGAGRRVVRMVGTSRDVSGRKNAEHERAEHQAALEKSNDELECLSHQLVRARNEAERANKARSLFLARMSHELRTPLSGILGYSRLLRMEGGLNDAQAERVDAMLGAGKHLLELINRVLDLSEIESEHVALQACRTDLREVATACLETLRPAAEAKGLALTIVMTPDTQHDLNVDPVRLRQILLILLGNAVKFTARGAVELRLRPTTNGSELRIEVADTGPGISSGKRQRLFQDFERLSTSAAVEGAGLGLALSARLAALMGGRIGHDDNPGGGSVFRLELPLNTVATSAAAMPGDAAAAPPEPAALHVLVVDDVLMNREIAGSFLRAAGHKVTCVEAGAEAVAAVESNDFDAVLMDVRMPGMDGLEATRRIRALEGARGRVPILAVTAQAFIEQVAECRRAGMDGHLSKPFEPETLLAAVVHWTQVGSARRQTLGPAPAKATNAPVIGRMIGAKLPVIDRGMFERTARFLTPDTVASHLLTIAGDCETLLDRLREPDAVTCAPDQLAEAAHALAGTAGMFGFARLAALGRRFVKCVQSAPAEAPALAEGLRDALEVTVRAIHDRALVAASAERPESLE